MDKIARNWTFTFNNFSQDEFDHLSSLTKETCKYIVFGKEKGELNNTPHLQGYVELNTPVRLVGCKKLLDPKAGKESKIHLEIAVAKNRDLAINYCKKGEQSHAEWKELGTKGPAFGLNAQITEVIHKAHNEGKGKRNDWNELNDFITENPDFNEIRNAYPEKAIKFPGGIERIINCVKIQNMKDKISAEMQGLELYLWQKKLVTELQFKPDNRKIIWYVDPVGNSGKTTLARYLLSKGDCAYFTNGSSKDISCAYNGEKIVILDFSRSNEEKINYGIIESLKNGLLFSPKYQSTTKVCESPFVIIMANFEPNKAALSQDRWDIRHLTPADKSYQPKTKCMHETHTPKTEVNKTHPEDNIRTLTDAECKTLMAKETGVIPSPPDHRDWIFEEKIKKDRFKRLANQRLRSLTKQIRKDIG